jgi:hypothetical protein
MLAGMATARTAERPPLPRDVALAAGLPVEEGMTIAAGLYTHLILLGTSADLLLHRGGEGGGVNPGNNLHVSGLSSRVDNRDLEALFSKHGKVSLIHSPR